MLYFPMQAFDLRKHTGKLRATVAWLRSWVMGHGAGTSGPERRHRARQLVDFATGFFNRVLSRAETAFDLGGLVLRTLNLLTEYVACRNLSIQIRPEGLQDVGHGGEFGLDGCLKALEVTLVCRGEDWRTFVPFQDCRIGRVGRLRARVAGEIERIKGTRRLSLRRCLALGQELRVLRLTKIVLELRIGLL